MTFCMEENINFNIMLHRFGFSYLRDLNIWTVCLLAADGAGKVAQSPGRRNAPPFTGIIVKNLKV